MERWCQFSDRSRPTCIGCSEPNFWDGGGFYKALSMPTENISKTAVYTAAGAAAGAAAVGIMNRYTKGKADDTHEKATIDDLEK